MVLFVECQGGDPRRPSWERKCSIHNMELVVQNHETLLATTARESLPGGKSATVFYGQRCFAGDSCGVGSRAERLSKPVWAKKLTYSVVVICASLLIPHYSASLSIWSNGKHKREIFHECTSHPPEFGRCFFTTIAVIHGQHKYRSISL